MCKKEKEKRCRQGRDPRTFDENNQGEDFRTPKTNSQGEDPSIFNEPVQRCRVQKKRKKKVEEKEKKDRKKKVKYRRSSWWIKVKGMIASLVAAKLKKEDQEKKGRKAGRVTNVPERDKSWASLEDC